jgi:type V secretory pathway adhesin AidA
MPTGWRKVDERTHAYRDCVALYTRTDNGTIETESHDTYDAHRALADMHLWIARGGKF